MRETPGEEVLVCPDISQYQTHALFVRTEAVGGAIGLDMWMVVGLVSFSDLN